MIDNLSVVVQAFTRNMLTLLFVDEILLPMYVNWSINFRHMPLLKYISPKVNVIARLEF